VLLKPSEGTQGREMNCKTRIASVLALAGFLCMSASPLASAGPLLSGYGGPGGGEQAIIGSALLGGPHGGSGTGGSSGSGGSQGSRGASGGASGGNSGGTGSNGSGRGRESASGSTGGTAVSSGRATVHDGSASHVRVNTRPQSRSAGAAVYVYPRSLRLASADSSVLAISGGDLLALIATIAFLSLVGALTARLVRLQR
jgi:hypothetical protein